MIRTLLTTTALTALLSTAAFAQDATTAPADPAAPAATDTMAAETNATMAGDDDMSFDLATGYTWADTDNLASRILGTPVYSGSANDAENIGTVNDLVVGDDGDIEAVIIGVGGFLGIGEKNVAVDFDQLEMVVAEDNTERWVLSTDRAALEAAPAFEFVEDQPGDLGVNNAADNAMAPVDNTADNAMAPADPALAPVDNTANNVTAVDRTTLSDLDETTLTAEELIGTRVVGPDNQHIADVGDIVLTPEGQIDAVLVDFGGFLGIGQKRVAIGMNDLDFAVDENGNRYVFLSTITREQLEAFPAYDETTYATDPNQRMTVGM